MTEYRRPTNVYDQPWDKMSPGEIYETLSSAGRLTLAYYGLGHRQFYIHETLVPIRLHHSAMHALITRGLMYRRDEKWVITARGFAVAQCVRRTTP